MSNEANNIQNEIDHALETQKRAENERAQRDSRQQRRVSLLGTGLRSIGVLVLIASVVTCMCQQWEYMDHLARYFSFLGFTGLVCGAGLVCGLKIRESKGARTLLGAVTTFIPVHCAQLGAILYSQTKQGATLSAYPSYLYWSVPTMSQALLALGVGLVTLIPMAYMAYSVLARRFAIQLFATGFVASAALLVPSRDPLIAAILLSLTTIFVLRQEASFSDKVELKTKEAIVARMVPMIAILTMVGRQAALYNTPSFFMGLLFALVSVVLFEMTPRLTTNRLAIATGELISIVTTLIAIQLEADAIITGFKLWNSEVDPLVRGLPLSLVFALMAERSRQVGNVLRASAAIILFLTGTIELCQYGNFSASCIALVIGIAAITIAFLNEQRALFFAGASLTLLALVKTSALAFSSLYVSSWIVMGLLGVFTIVGASYLEKNFASLREHALGVRRRIGAWK